MSRSKLPLVSIIIVNYNGRHLLRECLAAVYQNSYPKSRYEIIVVDNDSKDDSVSYLARYYPKVTVIPLPKNEGFAGGNIAGLTAAKGEYIVLLNNDTRVDKHWLRHLVAAAKPKNVGMVSPKLYFATPFLEITIKSDPISKSEITDSTDFSPMGVILEDVTCSTNELTSLIWYKSGFYEKTTGPITTRWTKGEAKIMVPFTAPQKEKYVFTIHGYPTTKRMATPISLHLNETQLLSRVIKSNQVKQLTITITRQQAKQKLIWLVQNAGNVVLHDGYSKDRGSITRQATNGDSLEFYEEDSQYYQQPTHLLSICGASCLIKREVIDAIGFFDGHYFMYYEDVDLSLRAWRSGWNIMYQPKSVVYHYHKATTGKVTSSFFISMVEKNHLAFTMVHFPFHIFLTEFMLFWIRTGVTVGKSFIFRFRDNLERSRKWNVLAEGRTVAAIYILKHFCRLFKNKLFWAKRQQRSYDDMSRYLY